ncbi:glycosyltransferase family 9 protein [Alteromonas sp. ASW11-36]|uniref:Glycosyltransferase family 9 protein n=1 Tax=Alteromonas arenosi TaxID=3055817 RepID=A0ABT7SSV2_9ALTE|nr:glycosyltransferase family 9 protein [Alteromonas sp. ASW11-36]MDM7859272.1 glycosyltransferase family 9 protein [Alteromonas sp. ASW11-36]
MRLSAIGDVCHAVAMVQAIQAARPDIQITWVIGKIEYQLLKDLPDIEFVVFDKKQGKQARVDLKQRFADTVFDALFMMQVAFRANWASTVINAKVKIGFDKKRSKELHGLFTNCQIAEQQHAHVLEGFMGFANAIGVATPAQPKWQMPMSEADLTAAEQLHDGSGSYAVICPAASKAERCWQTSRYAQVADHLHERGLKVYVCGAPSPLDTRLADEIVAQAKHPVHNLVGKTSLKQLLAFIQRAELVIAPDTGPAHMATTVGTPVIGLYAHSNPRRTGPYNNLDNVVSVYDIVIEQQTGKKWQALSWGKRAKGDDLMALIEVKMVVQQIEQLLGDAHQFAM